jgi:uncharacterized membrane protein
MTDFFFNAHSGWQYVTLIAVGASLGFSFRKTMTPMSERVYRISAVIIDIQVALGIVLWLFDEGWSLGFLQGWLHPIFGLAAVGAVHAVVSKARELDPVEANTRVRYGFLAVLVLVVAAIAVAEMA